MQHLKYIWQYISWYEMRVSICRVWQLITYEVPYWTPGKENESMEIISSQETQSYCQQPQEEQWHQNRNHCFLRLPRPLLGSPWGKCYPYSPPPCLPPPWMDLLMASASRCCTNWCGPSTGTPYLPGAVNVLYDTLSQQYECTASDKNPSDRALELFKFKTIYHL